MTIQVFLARYSDATMGLDDLDYRRPPNHFADLFGAPWDRKVAAYRAWRRRVLRGREADKLALQRLGH